MVSAKAEWRMDGCCLARYTSQALARDWTMQVSDWLEFQPDLKPRRVAEPDSILGCILGSIAMIMIIHNRPS